MIRSFADRETERLFQREFSRRFPPDIQRRERIKLEMLDAAERLEDLQQPPSNNLELLVVGLWTTPKDREVSQSEKS